MISVGIEWNEFLCAVRENTKGERICNMGLNVNQQCTVLIYSPTKQTKQAKDFTTRSIAGTKALPRQKERNRG